MRHFEFLAVDRLRELFLRPPQEFSSDDPPDRLALALGATLYCPANRSWLASDIERSARMGATSVAVCLEDAVPAAAVAGAEENLVRAFRHLHARGGPLPLLFVRVRCSNQIPDLVARLGPAVALLSGFILPKIGPVGGLEMLEKVAACSRSLGRPLYAMPVLESPDILRKASRAESLGDLAELFAKFREQVLAVRLGATDLCGLYGIRRTRTMTIYDVKLVADVISDVVNVLGRGEEGWRITGPVWEYFEVPATSDALPHGLMREIELDRANGLDGKTAIHPAQVGVVHAMSVVAHEDHVDAIAVLERADDVGGVFPGEGRDRMNESSPHQRWALDVAARAAIFGVARPGIGPSELVRAVRQ